MTLPQFSPIYILFMSTIACQASVDHVHPGSLYDVAMSVCPASLSLPLPLLVRNPCVHGLN